MIEPRIHGVQVNWHVDTNHVIKFPGIYQYFPQVLGL